MTKPKVVPVDFRGQPAATPGHRWGSPQCRRGRGRVRRSRGTRIERPLTFPWARVQIVEVGASLYNNEKSGHTLRQSLIV